MQNVMKHYSLLPMLIFTCSFLYAQNSNHQLLWKIEGKQLTQPSYLFGTMHVKDKRAFNFSDSVMTAIERCELFALEVEPHSAVIVMFDKMIDADTTNYLQELFNEDEYKKFKDIFEKRTGYKYDDLNSKNPMILQTMLTPDYSKSDDKQIVVDAYLYGIAKTMNKTMTGLEDVRRQVGMFASASKEEQKMMAKICNR